jgi:SRSO17 transposase
MMSVADWSGSLLSWDGELSALKERISPVFRRRELKETAGAFVDGLLSGIERKTGWLLAERAGLERPYRMQSLLGRSRWSADALRDQVGGYVVEALGDADGVLVVDETGFVAYASRFGQALIDRRLYLPQAWAEDDARRTKAKVPDDVAFATKPRIACDLIAAALDTDMPCAWVLADALYGSDSRLRRMLEQRGQAYVLAVRSNHCLRFVQDGGLIQTDPETLADALDADAWTPHAAGEGAKGLRLYEWARIGLPWVCDADWERWILIRRGRRDRSKRAYYLVFAPAGTPLAELAGAAGLRWTIEACFQRAKDDLGLDHCEARSWHGWHRHMSLCMAAAAFLAKLAAELRRSAWNKPNKRSPRRSVAA